MKAQAERLQRGFSLLEALVAMLVVSFGMLSVAGFQTTLSLNSDVAKQRTEATRLAQQKIEQLRTFDTLRTFGTNMVSSSPTAPVTQDTVTTNTSFTRSWGVTIANAIDTGRSVVVTVAWIDRAGGAQKVELLSHVSATDPVLNGSLLFPLVDGTILRRPKNRNIDIPIPAISISGTDKSYVPWSGSTGSFLVFNNVNGDVVQTCTATPGEANLVKENKINTANCNTFDGYLLTGYITANNTSTLDKVTKIVVPFGSVQYIDGTPDCTVGPALDQTSGAVIPGTKYYACLIKPMDHDNNTATARVWTGRVDLAGATVGSLIATQTCRFTSEPSTVINNLHPAVYSLVDRSLDNQNFYITSVIARANCPPEAVLHLINTASVP